MRKLITIDKNEDFLRQVSKFVTFPDAELAQEIEDLREYTLSHDVFAMASVQIGIPKRLVFLKSFDPTDTSNSASQKVMINPKITNMKGKTVYLEACQSCLDWGAIVERPYQIDVEFSTLDGKTLNQNFSGFAATVISHELDHLDGILHMDRAKKVFKMSRDERIKFRKNNPYKIISEDCEFSYDKINSK